MTPERFRKILTRQERTLSAAGWRLLAEMVRPFYALAVRWRNRQFDRQPDRALRVGVPVLSVGNLTLGGTGKSPAVLRIAQELESLGLKTAILSRGYRAREQKKRNPAAPPASPASAPSENLPLNDEGREMAERLPNALFFQNPNRRESACRAVAAGADVLLLDDGFQHRKLFRNGDVVLIDAEEPFGLTGRLFPCGTLREPMTSLARADVVILTHADRLSLRERHSLREELSSRFPAKPNRIWAETVHHPVGLVDLAGKPVSDAEFLERLGEASENVPKPKLRLGAFCGIGRPEGFRQSLAALGLKAAELRAFPDHHPFEETDCAELAAWAKEQGFQALLCTEKDRVKLPLEFPGSVPVFSLRMKLSFLEGEKEFKNWIRQTVQNASGHPF